MHQDNLAFFYCCLIGDIFQASMTKVAYLEGFISIDAAIRAGNRPMHTLYVQAGKRDRRLSHLRQTAVSRQIPVEKVTEQFIQARVSGKSHGGVIAEVGQRHFVEMGDLVTGQRPFVVMLDGIEDPFNFGQAIRALYAAGVNGLVVRPRNWMSAVSVVARSSAGASEWMPMAVAESADEAALFFREKGLLIACTTQKQATPIYETDLAQPIFLLIGGERRGVTRSFLEAADMRLEIPYGRPFAHSLGAAASAAILAFEVMRQRRLA